MDSGQRKRLRDELENEEEETEIIVSLLSVLIGIIGAWYHNKHFIKDMSMSDNNERTYQWALWMRTLCYDPTCFKQLRVNYRTFIRLCNVLCNEGGLVATRNVTIKEIVALFLYILGDDQKNCSITTTFLRSSETVSRQFHTVLRAVLKVGRLFIKQQSDGISCERDEERWKRFPNAMGALDGTFVKLTVPAADISRYRNRKGDISTNMLGVCDANLKFLYVLPGWEGCSSDARVLRDSLQRPNGLKVFKDQYYLVDAGYTNDPGFLAPYRSTHYHLNEWKGRTPTNSKELYNLRHSKARNAIERSFGLLKKRFAILRTADFYDLKTQIRIINACCILHNFVRKEIPIDPLLVEVDRELENRVRIDDDDEERITTVRTTPEWTTFRDNLATQMFEDYQARRAPLI